MGVSERDPNLEFEQSDFQEDLDSTVLVRERARGSKLESLFDRKAAKVIKESAHTITTLPEKSTKPKVYSKRDVASSSSEQNRIASKTKRKRVIYDSSISESREERKVQKKKKQRQAPEMAIEFEEEETPKIVDLAVNCENSESQTIPEKVAKNEKGQNPNTEQTEAKSEISGKIPKRVMERKRMATQRYGIDVTQVEKEDGKN